jgi:hypothetical protein
MTMTDDTQPCTFTGRGDDLICVDHDGQQFDIYAQGGAEITLRCPDTGDGLVVYGQVTQHGTWVFGATMLAEDSAFPDWDCVTDQGHDYSPAFTVHVPVGAIVSGR